MGKGMADIYIYICFIYVLLDLFIYSLIYLVIHLFICLCIYLLCIYLDHDFPGNQTWLAGESGESLI